MKQPTSDFVGHLSSHLSELQTQIKQLSEKDIPSVAKKVAKVIEDDVSENPYQALATAFGVGIGLGSLQAGHLKQAALYLGKLVAFRALSDTADSRIRGENAA